MTEQKKNFSLRKKAKRDVVKSDSPKRTWWVQIRLFPIWLRIIIVVALIALAAVLGAMIGFGVIGDGSPTDALKWKTWQHILDIMGGK